MGYLYYVSLGNKGQYDTSGNYQSDFGLRNNNYVFQHLFGSNYWSSTEYSADTTRAWSFHTFDGRQAPPKKTDYGASFAVMDGQAVMGIPDPPVAPEPVSSTGFTA